VERQILWYNIGVSADRTSETGQSEAPGRKAMSVLREYAGCSLVLLAGLLILAILGYFSQSRLIYYPHRYSLAELARVAEGFGLRPWPSEDPDYRGLVAQEPDGIQGTVVVFHGNGGSALDRLHYLAALEPLGFRVVLAEYPGYGPREGELSEASLVADAVTTVRLAAGDFPGPLYVWGESLGAAVASAVAADPGLPVEGLALITPFTSLPDMAQAVYRLPFLRPFVRDRYDSVAHLRGFRQPVAVLVSERDELIPEEQGKALYDSLQTEKRLWVFEGAGHNTWPAGASESWWAEVATFLEVSALPTSLPEPPTAHQPGKLTEAKDAFGTFYAYVPATVPEEPEILLLAHGTPLKDSTAEWNAQYYATLWMEFAEEEGLILLAPAFNQEDFSSRLGDHALSGYRGLFGREIGADEWVLRLARAHQQAYGSENGPFYLRPLGRRAIRRPVPGNPPRGGQASGHHICRHLSPTGSRGGLALWTGRTPRED
jgi:pimeloyl-ACP methyl ester carboxylesterase